MINYGPGRRKISLSEVKKHWNVLDIDPLRRRLLKYLNMGKNVTYNVTPVQKKFLATILKDPYIGDTFYLTGGTALSACYLNHRQSEGIDLFSL